MIGPALSGCSSDSIDELRKSGYACLEKKENTRAREYFLKALEEDNSDKESLVGLAQAYRGDARYDSAIYYLKRADLMHPKDRAILEQIRQVATALGDWQNAIDAIEAMIKLGDPKGMWQEQLAELWSKNGQRGRTFFHARNAIAYGTDKLSLYMLAADYAGRYDSVPVALELYDSALAKFGPLDQIMISKAILLSATGKPRQAEGLMRELVERDSLPNPDHQIVLAGILGEQPERARKLEAISIYRDVEQVHPGAYPTDSLIADLNSRL